MAIVGKQRERELVHFSSDISGIEIRCRGQVGQVPGVLRLTRSETHHCTASKEGYKDVQVVVQSSNSGVEFGKSTALNLYWAIWTLGILLPVGWLIDYSAGAMKRFDRKNYDIKMEPIT